VSRSTAPATVEDDPPDLRLVLPALAAWLVAWQGHRVPVAALLVTAGLLVALAAVLLLRHRRGTAVVVAAVCGCAAAAGLVTGLHTGSRTSGVLAELAHDESSVAVEAVLTADPRVAVPKGPATGRDLVVVRLRVEQLEARGRVHTLRAPVVLLSTDRQWLGLLPSQRVRAEGRLRAAEPGDDVAAVVSARGEPRVLSPPSRVQEAAGVLRAGLRRAAAPLPDAEAGLLPGLVVGDTSRLSPEIRADFQAVGLTHLTAVSGTNCSIVVGAVLLLALRLRLGLRLAPVLAGLALLGFVVLARPDPSVLRASVMGTIGLLGLATGTRRAAMPALSAAVLVLLLLDPDLAGTAGFALSVLATAGLLVLAPPWTEALSQRMPRWLAAAIAVPAAAQVACGPVVVALSDSLGLLTVPANLLAVPAVAPATVLGVLAALVAPVCLPVAQALTWLAWPPTAWLVLVGRVGAGLPGRTVPWPDGATGALLLAGLTAAVLPALTRRGSASACCRDRPAWSWRRRAPRWPRPPGRPPGGRSRRATWARATRWCSGPDRPAPSWWTPVRTRRRSTPASTASASAPCRSCCSATCTPTTSPDCPACSGDGGWGWCRWGRSTSRWSSASGSSSGSPGRVCRCRDPGSARCGLPGPPAGRCWRRPGPTAAPAPTRTTPPWSCGQRSTASGSCSPATWSPRRRPTWSSGASTCARTSSRHRTTAAPIRTWRSWTPSVPGSP
jgi:ComEC/Rec2-related protein